LGKLEGRQGTQYRWVRVPSKDVLAARALAS